MSKFVGNCFCWLVAVIISMVGEVVAQPSDPISEMEAALVRVDALIESSQAKDVVGDPSRVTADQIECDDIDAWNEAQKSSYSGVSGLELRAGYDRKYGTGSDDIYDDIYSYKNRFNAMLSWNILRSGLVGRASNDELVDLESERLRLDEITSLNEESIRSQAQLQGEVLDSYLNKVYTTKVEIYESLINLVNNLQNRGQATSMEMSQIEMEMEIARGSIRQTPIEVVGLISITEYLSTQVAIDPQMVESLTDSSSAVEKSRLNEQIVRNEAEGLSYWDKASISPYVKAQHYTNRGFTTSRTTANVGVTATLPLFVGTKSKRAEVQARSSLAANATTTTAMLLTRSIEECSAALNRNLERLVSLSNLERLYREQINSAREAYAHQQLTIREVATYYLKLLTLQSDTIKLIDERESLKTKLLLTTI